MYINQGADVGDAWRPVLAMLGSRMKLDGCMKSDGDHAGSALESAESESDGADVPSRRANGRPTRARAGEIQAAIFAAAMAEFTERGLHGGSIAGIAARANVTRATVYNHFSSKEAALEKLYQGTSHRLRASLEEVIDENRPVWEVLQDVARRLYRDGISGEARAVSRILILEADRFPELVSKGYELRWYCLEPLASYFEALSMKGVMALDDAPRAAQQFMHLVTSSVDSLFESEETFAKEHERWISSAVRIFLHGALRRS